MPLVTQLCLCFCSDQHFLMFLSSQCAFWVQSTCHSLWQGDFTCNRKQVVNRLKIPQGLSTLLFHRWSEVPSRGGVRGDSPYEKLPALQRCHLSVSSECCFLDLLAWPTSIRTLLLSGFVVVLSILQDSSSQSGFCRAPFRFDGFILGLFLWPSSAQLLLLLSGFAPFSISQGSFHSECFLLGLFDTLLLPTSQLFFLWFWSFQCFLGLLSSQCAVWGVFHICVTDCGMVIALVNRW